MGASPTDITPPVDAMQSCTRSALPRQPGSPHAAANLATRTRQQQAPARPP
jgi:hypothetical protein